jgi:hypothetical protein
MPSSLRRLVVDIIAVIFMIIRVNTFCKCYMTTQTKCTSGYLQSIKDVIVNPLALINCNTFLVPLGSFQLAACPNSVWFAFANCLHFYCHFYLLHLNTRRIDSGIVAAPRNRFTKLKCT